MVSLFLIKVEGGGGNFFILDSQIFIKIKI